MNVLPCFRQVALHWNGAHVQEHLQDCLSLLSPWCMAQHFATRSCAQIFCRRILERVLPSGGDPRWELLSSMVESSWAQGDKEKNERKLGEDFYLTAFDPERCFNARDIFR